MPQNLRFTCVPGGKLVYCISKDGQAVLVDYIGTGKILVIPPVINSNTCACDEIKVSKEIPDESFASCSSVEYIVDMCGCDFGMCVFSKCNQISGIISVEVSTQFNSDYSFVDERCLPRNIGMLSITAENSQNFNDYWDTGGNLYAARKLIADIVLKLAEKNDIDGLLRLSHLGNIGNSLRDAICTNDLDKLILMDSLGLLGEKCPFAYSIAAAIRHRHDDVFKFLINRHMFDVYWSDGSALFSTAAANNIDYTRLLLSAGHSPFARTPEWEGERPVLEYALEKNKIEIASMIRSYQLRGSIQPSGN